MKKNLLFVCVALLLTLFVKAQSSCNWVDGQDPSWGSDPGRGATDWNSHYNAALNVPDIYTYVNSIGNRLGTLSNCLDMETYAKMYADVGIKIGYYGETNGVWSGHPDQSPGSQAWIGHYDYIKRNGYAGAPEKVISRLNTLVNRIPRDTYARLYADVSIIVASYGVYGSNSIPTVAASDGDDDNVRATAPPPPLPVYQQPMCPVEGYLWTPGYWAYDRFDGYYWVPGVWVNPPHYGYLWTPAYWGFENGYYGWHRGYWGQTIGFYGGVNYGYGYGGSGFGGGRWEGNSFRYNTAVVNVNTTVIHNTYVDNTVIVNNTTVNRTSFNGPGGIQAKPTERELLAVKEQHVMATPEQTSHQKLASQDKSQFVSTNHGIPATAAMNKVGGSAFNPQGHPAPPPVPRPPVVNNTHPQNANQVHPNPVAPVHTQPAVGNNTHPQNTIEEHPTPAAPVHTQPEVGTSPHPINTVEEHPTPAAPFHTQPAGSKNVQTENSTQVPSNAKNGFNNTSNPKPQQKKAVPKPQQKRQVTQQAYGPQEKKK